MTDAGVSEERSAADQYRQAFQEEAREILVDLEETLLELGETPNDSELVGKAFRALHTIKGSGSMFGFEEVAAFTHSLENAFDEVRNGRLSVTPELVDLSLAAMDQIKTMLNSPLGANGGACDEIQRGLQKLIAPLEVTPPTAASPDGTGAAPGSGRERVAWEIDFVPGSNLLRNGSDPLLLLRELSEMGDLRVTADLSAVPPIRELDPERCYIHWKLLLATSAPREAIGDVFLFVEDECDLTIELAAQPDPALAEPAPNVPEEPERKAGRRLEGQSSIRVPTAKLDQFVNLVGELVTVQARLGEIAERRDDPDMVSVSEEVERLTSALRENSMSIRMMPIRGTFERFRRLVRDLARDLGKEVELNIDGGDTELDKTVIDQLNDPLMHLVRNSMDHGIESREVRLAAGKCTVATVRLSARYSGANVLIEVSDDGAGIDGEAVRLRAIAMGLVADGESLTESQVSGLILSPGFSTAQKVTDVSGRGVGMDVVRQRVEALRGTIQVYSKPGAGTRIELRLPLTLAIIDGLLVRVEQSFFVLPLANSLECIELTREESASANGRHVVNVRGEVIPYIRLREHFDIRTDRPEREQIMIAETEDGRCGFVVDEVLGDHQTVIKSLGRFYRQVQFVSGATILGDGTVALILDPDRIIQDVLRTESGCGKAHVPLQIEDAVPEGLQLNSS